MYIKAKEKILTTGTQYPHYPIFEGEA